MVDALSGGGAGSLAASTFGCGSVRMAGAASRRASITCTGFCAPRFGRLDSEHNSNTCSAADPSTAKGRDQRRTGESVNARVRAN